MNHLKKLAALAFATLLAASAHAIPYINGSVGFTGNYTATNEILNTAGNQFNITSTSVGASTGDLSGATSPLSFLTPINADNDNLVGNQLWSVTVGTNKFFFLVTTSITTTYLDNQVSFSGLGTMTDDDGLFLETQGEWQLGFGRSGTGTNASFTWQSTTAALGHGVPDGGSTVLLLGGALLSVALLRRKML